VNTERFNSQDDTFELPGFTAYFAFKTTGSIGFDLGIPRPPQARSRVILGHLEVHSPCTGTFATRFLAHFPGSRDLASLPQQERFQRCRTIMQQTFDVLELTAEEVISYDASFIFPTDSFVITHSPDCLYA
jgi:hypothetical protein